YSVDRIVVEVLQNGYDKLVDVLHGLAYERPAYCPTLNRCERLVGLRLGNVVVVTNQPQQERSERAEFECFDHTRIEGSACRLRVELSKVAERIGVIAESLQEGLRRRRVDELLRRVGSKTPEYGIRRNLIPGP